MSFAVRPIGLVKTGFVWRPTISADVTNWVLYSQALAAGWDGVQPLDAVVTVASGIVLSANSTSLYGFDTGSGFPVGTSLKLIMPGYVCGMGGAGGLGSNGSNGGPALRAQYAITIDALGGTLAGGGGGGGGFAGAGGGGGRSGRTNSAGGASSPAGFPGTFASGGNAASVGTPGTGGTTNAGTPGGGDGFNSGGGGGGGWGASGGAARSSIGEVFYTGGAGGAAVVGNSYITWINTGTRYGSIT